MRDEVDEDRQEDKECLSCCEGWDREEEILVMGKDLYAEGLRDVGIVASLRFCDLREFRRFDDW